MTSLFKRTNKTRMKILFFLSFIRADSLLQVTALYVVSYGMGKPRVVGSIPGRDTHSLWTCLRDGTQGKTLANETLAVATPSGKGEARSIFS